MNEIPQKVSESFRRLNPHLYSLGRLEAKKSEPITVPSLESFGKKLKVSEGCMVVCTLTAHRKRIIDDDNCTASLKPLRDGISESLGIDDGDKRISWQCSQVQTKGKEGVTVTIEVL